jgi:hypothetical protein
MLRLPPTLVEESTRDPLFNGSGSLAGSGAWDQSSWFLSSTASLSLPSTDSRRSSEYWHMVFGSRQALSAYAYTIFNCTIGDTRVDSQVFCRDSSCVANRMRQSQVDRRPPWTTPFNGKIILDNGVIDPTSVDDNQWNALQAMTTGLPWATGVIDHNVPAPAERYLVGDTDVIDPNLVLSTEYGNERLRRAIFTETDELSKHILANIACALGNNDRSAYGSCTLCSAQR